MKPQRPIIRYLLYIFCFLTLAINARADEVKCSTLVKPTKYRVQKGDHIAAILRTLQLEPVFGKNQSLDKLLKINKLPNPDLIEPGQELTVPFLCEEQANVWQLQDRGVDRLLTRKKENFVTANNIEIKPGSQIEADAVIESTQKAMDGIVQDNEPSDEVKRKNIEPITDTPPEMSEALRYRMICDGEWTGTECVTRYSILFTTLSGWYKRYDGLDPVVSTNNQGVLLSKLNPQIGIGWYNYWTENFKTELYASYEQSQLLPEAREIPIDQNKKYLGSFQLGARYEVGAWGVGLGYRQYDKLFYRFRFSGLSQPCFSNDSSFAGCGVFVHTATIGVMYADLSRMLYQAGKFRYDVKFTYMKLGTGATSSFQIKEGTGYSGSFRITHDRVKEYIFGDITYAQISQDTTIEQQKASELGFTFGYAWKLKDW